MVQQAIDYDLGQRRRAFRQFDGELDYDFCARKKMEKQERKRILGGRVIWTRTMGPFDKEFYEMMNSKEDADANQKG